MNPAISSLVISAKKRDRSSPSGIGADARPASRARTAPVSSRFRAISSASRAADWVAGGPELHELI